MLEKNNFLKTVIQHIQDAETNGPLVRVDFLAGFSGGMLLGALQRFVGELKQNEVYCEIGVFQGLSLVSVATANPNISCIGIDNFAYFDPNGTNKSTVERCARRVGVTNVELIDRDYEDALENLDEALQGRTIGVLFIDGPHDYRSQLMCLLLGSTHLSERAIVVVDDCNYLQVRQANRDFLVTNSSFKLVFENYTKIHPKNMTKEDRRSAESGWWNGVNILARGVSSTSSPILPPTLRDRTVYENEQIIQPMRLSDCAIEAMHFANSLAPLRPIRAIRTLKRLWSKARNSPRRQLPFDQMNMTDF